MRQTSLFLALAAGALWLAPITASAEMGPCSIDAHGAFFCGSGSGAARVIRETISPSKRFALAWRLINRPPTEKPDEGDSNLETLIVRVDDGAVLAKSHAFYWELADKQAKGQYL